MFWRYLKTSDDRVINQYVGMLQEELPGVHLTDDQWRQLARVAVDIRNTDSQQNERLAVLLAVDAAKVFVGR